MRQLGESALDFPPRPSSIIHPFNLTSTGGKKVDWIAAASLGKSHKLSRSIPLHPIWRRRTSIAAAVFYATSVFLLSFSAFKRENISLERRRISLTTSAQLRSSIPPSTDRVSPLNSAGTDIRPSSERACAATARDRGRMEWHERGKFKAASWDQRPFLPSLFPSFCSL